MPQGYHFSSDQVVSLWPQFCGTTSTCTKLLQKSISLRSSFRFCFCFVSFWLQCSTSPPPHLIHFSVFLLALWKWLCKIRPQAFAAVHPKPLCQDSQPLMVPLESISTSGSLHDLRWWGTLGVICMSCRGETWTMPTGWDLSITSLQPTKAGNWDEKSVKLLVTKRVLMSNWFHTFHPCWLWMNYWLTAYTKGT